MSLPRLPARRGVRPVLRPIALLQRSALLPLVGLLPPRVLLLRPLLPRELQPALPPPPPQAGRPGGQAPHAPARLRLPQPQRRRPGVRRRRPHAQDRLRAPPLDRQQRLQADPQRELCQGEPAGVRPEEAGGEAEHAFLGAAGAEEGRGVHQGRRGRHRRVLQAAEGADQDGEGGGDSGVSGIVCQCFPAVPAKLE